MAVEAALSLGPVSRDSVQAVLSNRDRGGDRARIRGLGLRGQPFIRPLLAPLGRERWPGVMGVPHRPPLGAPVDSRGESVLACHSD